MKKLLIMIIAVIFITVFIPLTIVLIMSKTIDNTKSFDAPETAHSISVYIHTEDTITEMDMLSYLAGVTAAEMPSSFNTEALKAQSVAARTYLISHMRNGKDEAHKGADICTDSTHCQAWISEADFKKTHSSEDWEKVKAAVSDTEHEIIAYNDKPISAVFFSTSSGITENAENVWGKEVPYLKSVKSEGDELSPRYTSDVTMSIDEFKKKSEEKIESFDRNGKLIENIVRTSAGGIKSVTIGGVEIHGTEFRSIFGLRSTNAEVEIKENEVKFKVKGNGHNVGMSQYGANYLASQGKDYKTILTSYYTDVDIKNLSN